MRDELDREADQHKMDRERFANEFQSQSEQRQQNELMKVENSKAYLLEAQKSFGRK